MEYYLTTYTKDYKWPVRRSPAKLAKDEENRAELVGEQIKPEPCAPWKYEAAEEPVIDPAQCGAPPAGPESSYDQPLTYLRKLYQKYPYLYQILKLTPPDQLAKTIYDDKYKSTYTSDYKVEGFEPFQSLLTDAEPKFYGKIKNQEREEMERLRTDNAPATVPLFSKDVKTDAVEARLGDPPTCGCVEAVLSQLKTSYPVKKVARKPCSISNIPRLPPTKKKPEECQLPQVPARKQKMNKWRTEYRDTISKVGGIIIKKKLLSQTPEEMQKPTVD